MKLSKIDWVKKYIKLKLSYFKFREVFLKLRNNIEGKAVLIGTPVHGNLGDSLIATECLKYIKSIGFEEVIEVPEFLYELFRNRITINKRDVIFIVGGGWMGDLYEDELVVEDIIEQWPDNIIVILPQTICFTGRGKFSSVDKLSNVLEKADNLILTVRERRSYNVGINDLRVKKENCILLPDMALLRMKNVLKKEEKYKKIIFSMRNDVEKNLGEFEIEDIIQRIEQRGIRVEKSSTVIKDKFIKILDREKYINLKIEEFSKADLVVTDRLHSMIFSLIAGTKCLAIDNLTKKVSEVYKQWLDDISGMFFWEDINELTYEEILKVYYSDKVPCSKEFDTEFKALTRRIEEIRNYE